MVAPPQRAVQPGCLGLAAVLLALAALPWLLANAGLAALAKLGLSPGWSTAVLVAMLLGGLINLPLYRFTAVPPVPRPPPWLGRPRRLGWPQPPEGVVAVNLGGCVVPLAVVVYQLLRLANTPSMPWLGVWGAVALNVAVCHWSSKLVLGVGVLMRPLVPAAVAVLSAWVVAPNQAASVAFVAGVLGPLVGADLLRLPQIRRLGAPLVAIGGAGTFDGIVVSGVVAVLLA